MNILRGERIDTYSVYGRLENADSSALLGYRYYIVLVDNYNSAFMLEPIAENKYQNLDEMKLERRYESINRNDRNGVKYNRVQDEDVAKAYFYEYRYNMLNNIEEAYNSLEQEYREKRFGNLEGYKTYVEANEDKLRTNVISKYQVNHKDDYVQYVCIDQNNNYYIMKETSVMKYSVMLDTYTIDIPEFIEKYDKTENQGKVVLNIQKVVDSINAKDYNYSYSKLANEFKNTNFPSLQSFETYIKNTLYNNNKIEYKSFDEEAGLYTYQVIFRNSENEEDRTIEKTIIMRLGEGTEFTLSFNAE